MKCIIKIDNCVLYLNTIDITKDITVEQIENLPLSKIQYLKNYNSNELDILRKKYNCKIKNFGYVSKNVFEYYMYADVYFKDIQNYTLFLLRFS